MAGEEGTRSRVEESGVVEKYNGLNSDDIGLSWNGVWGGAKATGVLKWTGDIGAAGVLMFKGTEGAGDGWTGITISYWFGDYIKEDNFGSKANGFNK